MTEKKRIAIVGSGISGLGAAWLLSHPLNSGKFDVILFEAENSWGGHTCTVQLPSTKDVAKTCSVDMGFIVCNPLTYPNFLNFAKHVGFQLDKSDMSFAVSKKIISNTNSRKSKSLNDNADDITLDTKFEWAGRNLRSMFAQKSNLIPSLSRVVPECLDEIVKSYLGVEVDRKSGDMYVLVKDIFRFHDLASKIADESDGLQKPEDHPVANLTLAEFFTRYGFSTFFYENYIVPMVASIWSTPADKAFESFPLLTLVRFMRNHRLLQIGKRPTWLTVNNGSKTYLNNVLASNPILPRLGYRVTALERGEKHVKIKSSVHGKHVTETFDWVILACHADTSLNILGPQATPFEREILSPIAFTSNTVVLHRDPRFMPARRACWSSWNYISIESNTQTLCLTYWMNILQNIDSKEWGDVFVTVNPPFTPKNVVMTKVMTHPLYSRELIKSQSLVPTLPASGKLSLAGAWTNFGFHEDGLTSGLMSALQLGAKCPFPVVRNGGYKTSRAFPELPNWVFEPGTKTNGREIFIEKYWASRVSNGVENGSVNFRAGSLESGLETFKKLKTCFYTEMKVFYASNFLEKFGVIGVWFIWCILFLFNFVSGFVGMVLGIGGRRD